MSLGPELTNEQNQLASAFIALGYELHMHQAGERTRPRADLQAALDWVRRVMNSNPEMQQLADFVEKACTTDPAPPKPAERGVRDGMRLLKERFTAYKVPPVDLPAESVIEDVVRAILALGRLDEPRVALEIAFAECDECGGSGFIRGAEVSHGWHKPERCPKCAAVTRPAPRE